MENDVKDEEQVQQDGGEVDELAQYQLAVAQIQDKARARALALRLEKIDEELDSFKAKVDAKKAATEQEVRVRTMILE